MSYTPFPVCAKATNARATKNSSFDTRGRELTRFTICSRMSVSYRQLVNGKVLFTLSIIDADSPEVDRTRERELTEISPVPEGSITLKAL